MIPLFLSICVCLYCASTCHGIVLGPRSTRITAGVLIKQAVDAVSESAASVAGHWNNVWNNVSQTNPDVSKAIDYLESESIAAAEALQTIRSKLRNKGIHIGPMDDDSHVANKNRPEIALSTDENEIECRVSLGPVPHGVKAISPCGCTGSQKWVQYSVFNRLRRKEPNHWKTCKVRLYDVYQYPYV
jgi:hypothetical protein